MDLDLDFLDAYKLTIGETFLYGKYENFIADFGIPSKLTIVKADFTISTKEELDKLVTTAKDPTSLTLHYPGIEMSYSYDNYIIPFTIDFRKSDKSLFYGETAFNTSYTVKQFKRQFPNSANPPFNSPQSLFEIVTNEKGGNYEHYTLMRKSKDDPDATPTIEYTFHKGKLIFILFANF